MTTPPARSDGAVRDAQGRPPDPLVRLCFGIPAAILVACYAWLAVDRSTAWLWDVPVHESGRYTLGGTIFYVSHFLREIPTDVVYALFVLGAASGALAGSREPAARRLAWPWFACAAVLVAVALLVSAAGQGWTGALRDLAQMRTRDDLVAYGSHWRFHWLSTLWFGAAAFLIVPRVVPAAVAGAGDGVAARLTASRLAWGAFAGLTLVFGMSADIFTDVRYAGHQAREILTHGPITGLLAIGLVRRAAVRNVPPSDRTSHDMRPTHWLAAAPFVIIPLWVGAVALAGDPMAAGQSEQGLAAMVAGHVFEHTLDYVLVLMLVGGGCALMMEERSR